MLERVGRMQLAVRDREEAAAVFAAILGAQTVREDAVRCLGAARTTVRAGSVEFELLQPSGDGAVADHLSERPEGIFAGGFGSRDLNALAGHLASRGQVWPGPPPIVRASRPTGHVLASLADDAL